MPKKTGVTVLATAKTRSQAVLASPRAGVRKIKAAPRKTMPTSARASGI
jgi:hypothetical protein